MKSHNFPNEVQVFLEFHIADARRRSPVRAGDATRIQEANTANCLVARNVSVTMQKNIAIFQWAVRRRWNVLQTKPHALSDEIKSHRPRNFAVAVSPHHRYRWPKQSQLIQQCRGADIAQVPNFVHPFNQSGDVRRQTIVRIGDDEDARC